MYEKKINSKWIMDERQVGEIEREAKRRQTHDRKVDDGEVNEHRIYAPSFVGQTISSTVAYVAANCCRDIFYDYSRKLIIPSTNWAIRT